MSVSHLRMWWYMVKLSNPLIFKQQEWQLCIYPRWTSYFSTRTELFFWMNPARNFLPPFSKKYSLWKVWQLLDLITHFYAEGLSTIALRSPQKLWISSNKCWRKTSLSIWEPTIMLMKGIILTQSLENLTTKSPLICGRNSRLSQLKWEWLVLSMESQDLTLF